MLEDEKRAPFAAALLSLEPEEIAFLLESKSITKKIQKIYDEAQAMVETQTAQEIELFGGFGKREEAEEEEVEKEEPEIEVKKETKTQSSLFDF